MIKLTIKTVIYAALLAAVTAVLAQIAIPLPGGVPFTLQVFAVFLGIFLLGKKSFWGMLTYLLLGAIGLPVFAQARGGIGVILGPTGGYLLGFALSGLIGGFIVERSNFNIGGKILAVLVSLILIYSLGTIQLAYILKLPLSKAIAVGVKPFVPWDIIKGVMAILLATHLQKALTNAGVKLNG
ncbi:bioY family protein [Carboxydothermus hydrogenoformans Z-2901]|uniref:Biotin transporter n=1 Tax=Carboxydothermus hydrogenoformans (strain ATCC BAA-161 / DSM 6008 / Z-2901) TaxID=246194 RepID=Q3ABM1_CARHZ|nr:bioY family protein [Carboxydothermus hydrogenoformans Z-2901]